MSKKRTKKYNPHKSARRGLLPHELVQLSNSREPLPERRVNEILSPLADMVADLKAGCLKRRAFRAGAMQQYLFVHMLELIRQTARKTVDDDWARALLMTEVHVHKDVVLDKGADVLLALSERFEKRGRFVATGDELRVLEQSAEFFEYWLRRLPTWVVTRALCRASDMLNEDIRLNPKCGVPRFQQAA